VAERKRVLRASASLHGFHDGHPSYPVFYALCFVFFGLYKAWSLFISILSIRSQKIITLGGNLYEQ
jgi:hypothetical protein